MMTIRSILKSSLRFIFIWFANALAILITTWIIPGFSFVQNPEQPLLVMAASAAFILGVVNLLIRPILLLFKRSHWVELLFSYLDFSPTPSP